jgi:YegS/Rv2252/BmrU family lipid kinase
LSLSRTLQNAAPDHNMTSIRRVLLIVNPASRRGARIQRKAAEAFSAAGIQVDVRVTKASGHAARIAEQEGRGYDAVFSLGGDGTAMEVIAALAGTGTPVGVLAGGTGNVIARSLGIPVSLKRSVPLLLNGRDALIDLGRMDDGRRFAIGIGVGIDAAMIAETPTKLKRRLGVLAYVIVGVRSVMRFEHFDVRLTVDGHVLTTRASAVLIANFGTLLNHLITLGSGIEHDDGLLNACVFSPRSIRDFVRITWRLMTRNFSPDPCLHYMAGKEFLLETTPSRQTQADGELWGPTPVRISVEPRVARLLLPSTRK